MAIKQHMLYEISHNSLDFPKPIPKFYNTGIEAFAKMIELTAEYAKVPKEEILQELVTDGEFCRNGHYVCSIFANVNTESDKEDYLEWAIYEVSSDDNGHLTAYWGSDDLKWPLNSESETQIRRLWGEHDE